MHLAVSPGVSRGPTVEFSDRSASVSRDAPAPVDRRSLATSLDRWAADGPAESCIEPICIETKCTTATHCSAHAGSVTSDVAKTALHMAVPTSVSPPIFLLKTHKKNESVAHLQKNRIKKTESKKQNQKNALKLFLQSRRPLLAMHPYRPLLAMWYLRAGHFSSSSLSSIIFCNRMFSSFKLIISFKSLFISLKSILFCIFKYVLYKFGLQSIIIYGNIIPI